MTESYWDGPPKDRPYWCAQCGVWSAKPHDHTDDTVESIGRPRHDY